MDIQDKTTFSLDDDEEIVEEEVIDRDEEYEDDDYDDEDYGDEEYDEEYDDEDYGDEEYDDGYSDDYYDDRLNKVLDELAELKRGMAPATVQQPQQPIIPQYIYQPTAPPAGSEIVMYNEISRLRDELAKNQSSLEMQKEITRMKEDFARDQRFAEAQHNAEIQRLQSKIDDLLKNASSPQSELPEGEPVARLEGGNLDVDKLISINEAILRAMRDSDARVQSELGQLKKQIEEFPSAKELNGAVSSVRKAVNSIANGLNTEALSGLADDIMALKALMDGKVGLPVAAEQGGAASSDISASELLRQLYDIKTALGSSSQAVVDHVREMSELVGDYKKVCYDVSSSAVSYKDKLNSAYGYAKKLEDCDSADSLDLVDACNAVLDELTEQPLTETTFADLAAYCSERGIMSVTPAMRDTADKYFGLCKKLAAADISTYGDYLPDLLSLVNTLENNKYEADNAEIVGEITTSLLDENDDKSSVKDNIAKLTALTVADVIDLPRVKIPAEYKTADNGNAQSVFDVLADMQAALGLERVTEQTTTASSDGATEFVDGESVERILAAIADVKRALGSITISDGETVRTVETAAYTDGVSMDEIRSNYLDITNKLVEISERLQEPLTVETTTGERTTAASSMTDEEKSAALDDLAYIREKSDEYAQAINGIAELRDAVLNMGGTGDVSEQFGSVVSEINAQFDKLYEDLSNVLIESEANILNKLGESPVAAIETAKSDIIAEVQAVKEDVQAVKETVFTVTDATAGLSTAEALEAARADILAETQAIKDSLIGVTDSAMSATLSDAVDQLRADIAVLIDNVNANADMASVDRQRIVDDVTFLREQAELALSEEDQIPDGAEAVQDTDKFISYLDDISARVALIGNIADDTATIRDGMAAVTDGMTAVNDTVNSISGNFAAVTDGMNAVNDTVNAMSGNVAATLDTVTSMGDSINAMSDNVAAMGDNVAAVNDYAVAINDNVAALGETLRPMADDVLAAKDAAAAALDAIAPITDQLNAILDRLEAVPATDESYTEQETSDETVAAQSLSEDELNDIRDGINALLDTIPLFPQADDVVVTRDNVAAVLESLNVLTDSINAIMAQQDTQGYADELAVLRDNLAATDEDIKYIRQKIDDTPQTSDEQAEDLATIMQDIGIVLDRIEQFELTAANNKQEIVDVVNGIKEEIHINTLDENMSAAGLDGETRDALLGEIAEIRERLANIESSALATGTESAAAIDGLSAQIADLMAYIEQQQSGIVDGTDGTDDTEVGGTMSDDNMQALIAELGAIREKLDAAQEYDTVEEILSLREDIKASRLVDQDEVTSELESIKNELAAISSGNILDEIRALREDIVNMPAGGDGDTVPTQSEINLVLNEIVSLRDEVFALKDEILAGAETVQQPTEQVVGEEQVVANDDLTTVLDEIEALRADQSAININIDELKDIVSRRTTIAGSDDGEGGVTAAGDELNVVLDEIINLKNDIDRIEESIGGDRLTAVAEQVEEMRAALDALVANGGVSTTEEITETEQTATTATAAVDLEPIMEQFDVVNAALEEIRLNREVGGYDTVSDNGALAARFDALEGELADIKATVAGIAPVDYAEEMAELRAEIDALRQENEQLKAAGTDELAAQLAELKEAVHDLALSSAPVTTDSGDTSYAALIDEIRALKDQVATASMQQAPVNATATLDESTLQAIRDALATRQTASNVSAELGEIRDEIAQLRSLTTITAESGGSADIAAMREEIAELRQLMTGSDHLFGVAEDVTAIKADVQTLKDEPDLGVMSEILALRDEFQALREQIEEVKRVAGETDKASDESLMSEVQSLRDQLFAISMANVNDPASGESNYESYNNIILDEIASLRDQVSAVGSASDLEAISEEFAQLRDELAARDDKMDELAQRVTKLAEGPANDSIMGELAALREEMSNQRDADLTTLNFMSEISHLIERQNQYMQQSAETNISSEIESLKAEIASSDAVAEEVAKLREVMMQAGSAADNENILYELAGLREELSKEKPSRENALILDAISRLRDEVVVLAEREAARDMNSDADLSDSLTDLKSQLTEIANIMEPEKAATRSVQSTAPQTSTPTGGAKRGRKPGQKNGTGKAAQQKKQPTVTVTGGAKRGRKPKAAQTPVASVTERHTPENPTIADLDRIIDEQASKLGGDGIMSLNPQKVVTADAMDIADKLAKQVANKLIMEQLVEQLGDGGVSEEHVNEILRDILPQEFTTIAETEASDKVRRLANQLVLNKLRSRLNGNRSGDDD